MKPRILVMEDDKLILEDTSGFLEEIGCETVGYSFSMKLLRDLESAEERGLDIDAALVDLELSGNAITYGGYPVDGHLIIRRLRETHPQIKILSISGYPTKAPGADAHYRKAHDPMEIWETLRRWFPGRVR